MPARSPIREDFEKTVGRLAAIIGHGGQGLALARALALEGVRTRADLRRPAVLARLPRGSQASVLYSPVRSAPLAAAAAVAAEVKRRLVFELGGRRRRFEVIPVGSLRRQAPRVKDVDFLVVLPAEASTGLGGEASAELELERVLAAATLRPPRAGDVVSFADTYAAGTRRRSFVIRAEGRGRARARHYRSDFFVTTAAEKPYALYHYTGPREYNIRTRAHAKRLGWLLNQYGLFVAVARPGARPGARVRGSAAVRSERDLARLLGVTYYPPRARGEGAQRPTASRSPR